MNCFQLERSTAYTLTFSRSGIAAEEELKEL